MLGNRKAVWLHYAALAGLADVNLSQVSSSGPGLLPGAELVRWHPWRDRHPIY